MTGFKLCSGCVLIGSIASFAAHAQTRNAGPVLYESARLIVGDRTTPVENGAFLVENGRIAAIGRKGALAAPSGGSRVDLTGKTVMPAFVNAHVHIGYE